jgi:hypothetical protein
MDKAALRQRLGDMFEEESADVDWKLVERMCDKLSQNIDRQPGLDCTSFFTFCLTQTFEPGMLITGGSAVGALLFWLFS